MVWMKTLGLVAGLAGIAISLLHPVAPIICTVVFLVVGWCAYRYETFWLMALPSILVCGSLYPWTGNILVQEYDIGLCALISARWLQSRTDARFSMKAGWIVWAPIGLIFLIGALRGLMTLPSPLWGDQLSIYTTATNTLQQFKVMAYAAALVPLLSVSFGRLQEPNSAGNSTYVALEFGIIISAIMVSSVVFMERFVTVGLFDFEKELRAAGPCTSMHIGDQHLDAYWALALPMVFRLRTNHAWQIMLLGFLQIASLYAIFATMSRATIASAAVSLCVLTWMQLVYFRGSGASGTLASPIDSWRRTFVVIVLGLGMAVACAGLWMSGGAVPRRFNDLLDGWNTRQVHWQGLLALASRSPVTLAFGNGLGSFPLVNRRRLGRSEQPIELISVENGKRAVRLYAEESVYLEQLVNPNQPLPWTVSAHVKTSDPNCKLGITICHKVPLQSYDCVNVPLETNATIRVDRLPNDVTDQLELPRRRICPTSFGFTVSGKAGQWIEIHDLKAVDSQGQSVLQNSRFENGSRFWFFSCDDHLIWRAKNCWVHWIVEVGLIGAVSALLLFGVIMWRFFRSAWCNRDWPAFALFWSLLGFLQISFFGTLVDVPWIMIFVVVLLAAGNGQASSKSASAIE